MHLGRWFVAALSVTAVAVAFYASAVTEDSPHGSVLWTADAERPLAVEWASSSAAPADPSAACESLAPPDSTSPRIRRSKTAAQGRYSYAITVKPGDDCHGERAELGQGNPSRDGFGDRLFNEGDERWISFQIRLGRNFDPAVSAWRVVMQLHQVGDGSPPLSLDVEDGNWILYRSDLSSDSVNTDEMWAAPATTGRWVRFTLHVKFSPDPKTGFVELWGNPAGGAMVALLSKTATHTMKDDALPLHARIGVYRNPDGPFGTETVLYDGFTVANTREAAEGNAFR
ncbi:MAG: hypothetical protein QOJ57_2001 [Thermoleophilaceae bacterium]|jgi:hypothetical protein|nr:hypothetical protein [Thermoleophilaceae bacterium]